MTISVKNIKDRKLGKLKIYIGYAAGVGKTFAMLNDSHTMREDGHDIVIGYVEHHRNRPETEALFVGLEIIPPLVIHYNGVEMREFDLDGVLTRHPEIVIVDELAHKNAFGFRHRKRYQDIEELLNQGIDVYTTINIQHFESLANIVEEITGIFVNERVPDRLLDEADQIELVDIEVDELIGRLKKGKIYEPSQAKLALDNFFQQSKLIALRELALRKTAEKVGMIAFESSKETGEKLLTSKDRIMVCLSPALSNQKVIRESVLLADAFFASLSAIYIEENSKNLAEHELNQLLSNIHLAEQLGAEVVTLHGDDKPTSIYEYAKFSGITKIVLGRSGKRSFFRRYSFADRLLQLDPSINLYIIPDRQYETTTSKRQSLFRWTMSFPDILISLGLLLICTFVGIGFEALDFTVENIITVYILGVILNAVLTTSSIYSIISSVISILLFNYLFVDPKFSFDSYSRGYPVTFGIMLIASIITSTLTSKLVLQGKIAAKKAYRTEVMLETSHQLQEARGEYEALDRTAKQLNKLLNRNIVIYPVVDEALGSIRTYPLEGQDINPKVYSQNEKGVALWVLKNRKRAGATTSTLSAAYCLYLAVRSSSKTFAVVGIEIGDAGGFEIFERNLMIAMLAEVALVLDKEATTKVKEQAERRAKEETLRSNMLRAISHDLRTPLTSISGNATMLKFQGQNLSNDEKMNIYNDIIDDSTWLINLVENLLSMTRIENGRINMNIQPELVADVVEEALDHVSRQKDRHHLTVNLEDEFLVADMDAGLFMQVIINVVDNALKHTQEGSSIALSVHRDESVMMMEIADDGPGIPDILKSRIFDMFYTTEAISSDSRRGLGIGLALCQSIVQAHQGIITVHDNVPRGSRFTIRLPIKEVNHE